VGAQLSEERAPDDWGGAWEEAKAVVLREQEGAVVTSEGAVWWPQPARPPLTKKQIRAVAKRDQLRAKLGANDTAPGSGSEPGSERTAESEPEPDLALPEVVETVEDLISEVEAILELEQAKLEVEQHTGAVNTIAAMWRRKQVRFEATFFDTFSHVLRVYV
jgi:hypothetical protein